MKITNVQMINMKQKLWLRQNGEKRLLALLAQRHQRMPHNLVDQIKENKVCIKMEIR